MKKTIVKNSDEIFKKFGIKKRTKISELYQYALKEIVEKYARKIEEKTKNFSDTENIIKDTDIIEIFNKN